MTLNARRATLKMKSEYPDQPIVSVGAIVMQDGRALIVKRREEPGRGMWSVPGGKVELGETLRDAVAREAHEETGMIVQPGEMLAVSDAVYRDNHGRIQFHYVFVDFLCRAIRGELRAATDAADVRWLSEVELDTTPITPTAQRVLRKAFGLANGLRDNRPAQ